MMAARPQGDLFAQARDPRPWLAPWTRPGSTERRLYVNDGRTRTGLYFRRGDAGELVGVGAPDAIEDAIIDLGLRDADFDTAWDAAEQARESYRAYARDGAELKPVDAFIADARDARERASLQPNCGPGHNSTRSSALAERHCRVCGICEPLPDGVTWRRRDLCSECVPAALIAPGTARNTEPCPVKGCSGWRHPNATVCDSCKLLLPRDLHLKLMQASIAEKRPDIAKQYGPFDRPALKQAAIEAAANAREARR